MLRFTCRCCFRSWCFTTISHQDSVWTEAESFKGSCFNWAFPPHFLHNLLKKKKKAFPGNYVFLLSYESLIWVGGNPWGVSFLSNLFFSHSWPSFLKIHRKPRTALKIQLESFKKNIHLKFFVSLPPLQKSPFLMSYHILNHTCSPAK